MLKVNLPSFNIDHKEILKDIALELKDGDNLTILGSNGAGKSTLAKLLCGLYRCKQSIKLEDTFIELLTYEKRAALVNYIPPKLSIYDDFITVEDFLELSRDKQTKTESKILKTLKLLGLENFYTNYCGDLSSGQQQLLLLGSALMHNAKLTIFDEPTSNLDPQRIKLVYEILKNHTYLRQKIIITHNLQLAYKLNYPLIYIDEGRGRYFENVNLFFEDSNLEEIFKGSVTKNGEDVVIRL